MSNGINLDTAKVQRLLVVAAVMHKITLDCNEDDPPAPEEIVFMKQVMCR